MYGQIHCVIRELVQTKFGNEAWETILRKSTLDEHDSFLMFTRYDDSKTFSLVGAVSDTLGVPVETVLEIFGEFFFDYCLRHGYDKMLRTLGSDIKSFIQNLDSLHSLLALSYKGISAPSFRCEDGPSGELILHYYSGRPGLYPIVKGVLKAVARDLFQQSVEMSIIEQNKEDIGCNQSQEHTAFRVLLRTDSRSSERSSPEGSCGDGRELVEFCPETVLLRATDFCSAFPYHIIFDRDLRIRQCGDLVQKHSHTKLTEGLPLTKAFSIVHPKMVLSIDNIRKFINAVFLLAIMPGSNGRKTLLLKGQMIWLADTKNMIFIGSPRLTSLNELMEMNVYLADIPLYDVTRELVLLNQQRIAEIDIAKRLDETTAELKRTSQALEDEKSKTETLLHQMLPRKVATALTHGQKVEAEKFDQVTILFSDIVTFTNIAAACSPMDIVNMLNEMYQRFDERTSQHNVYKVETIGDAYMIVSGVPEKTNIHAQPVASFAMDMIEDAGLVRSPATGLPLQIRVGVHTGPVVAGVVGVKMPRYCLFGDTVNTASRMESHGVPGRIHLSPTVYQALRGWGYAFKHRGEMQVKGKGEMSTYFLCGHLNRRLVDLDDDFKDLEIHQDGTENGDYVEPAHLSQNNMDQEDLQPEDSTPSSSDMETEDGDENNKPIFYGNSASDNSLETAVIENGKDEQNGMGDQSKAYQNSNSAQSLGSTDSLNKSKLVRNKKISRSSNDSFRIVQDTRVESQSDMTNNNSSKTTTVTSSTTVSPTDEHPTTASTPDCVYINGSFRDTFRGQNSIKKSGDGENTDGALDSQAPQLKTSEERLSPISQDISVSRQQETENHIPSNHEKHLTNCHCNCEEETPPKHKCDHCENEACPNRAESSDWLTVNAGKGNNLTFPLSAASSTTSLQSGRSLAKSETFPMSSSCSPKCQIRPSSASHGDLNDITTNDTKRKKKKKRNSKMCSVA